MKYFFIGFSLLFLSSLSQSQSIEIVTYDQLEERWSSNSDTLYVVNYWATWCGPCVEELPDFIAIHDEFKDGPFKMLLVSLDFPKMIEKRVIPFIAEKNITPDVVLLDDNPNIWINRVCEDWDGDIPVTQFIKGDHYELHIGQLHKKELEDKINSINK